MTINIVVPYRKYCSFYSCAYAVASWLSNYDLYISQQLRFGVKNILIYDTVFSNSFKFIPYQKYTLFWVDSPLKNTKKIVLNEIVVCASWEAQLRKQEGFNVLDVVGRLINPLAFTFDSKDKTYDLMIFGNYDPHGDRKNIIQIQELFRKHQDYFSKLKIIYIGNYDFNLPFVIKKTNISELEKFELMSKTKYILHIGGAEGFYMPFGEALACSCLPIGFNSYNFLSDCLGQNYKYYIQDYTVQEISTKYGIMIKVTASNLDYTFEILKEYISDYDYEYACKCKNKFMEYQIQQYYKLLKYI